MYLRFRVYSLDENLCQWREGIHFLLNLDDIEDGDTIVANIVGSSSTIFRSSNEFLYEDPDVEHTEEPATETEQPSTDTEGSTQSTEKSTEQSSEQSLSGAGTATDQSVEHTVNTPLTQN